MAEKDFKLDQDQTSRSKSTDVTTEPQNKTAPIVEAKTGDKEPPKAVDTNEVLRKAREAEFDRNKKRIERKAEILSEYGNLESMIPLGHEYWNLGS